MEKAIFCKGCWIQWHGIIPIRGLLSMPFRLFGIKPSEMNPNICNLCETQFTKIKHAKQITYPATIMFADIRGYTSYSEIMDIPSVARLLSGFYENCGDVIWERDGLIIKLIGDAMLSVFNFPITREDHVKQAVMSGLELQRKCLNMKASLEKPEECPMDLGIGVGIHTGNIAVGEIGQFCRDFVNLAARLQGVAKQGEVVITEDVYREVKDDFPKASTQIYEIKGIKNPVKAFVLHP
jgi:class 3 adenylate cyclase